jgi:MarR family transcriptional regulator, negative regulator of the multidrug operon emrRAB
MRHAHNGREANLLGAASVAIADRLRLATEEAACQGGSAPAALVSLAGYLDGRPIDSLRDPLGLTHSAAVRVVDRLVEAGLARRRPGPDGRSVAVELTAAGHQAASHALRARQAVLEAAMDGLTHDEQAQLVGLHEKLLAALTDGRRSARRTCRLCDLHACGHNDGRCPVTNAANAAASRT